MKLKLVTVASTIGAVTNAVQLSECVQLAITQKGSTPLDPMIPPRYRRLSAVLQIPVLIALLCGEVAKVREAIIDSTPLEHRPLIPRERGVLPGYRTAECTHSIHTICEKCATFMRK